jgi:hypothetical protein
VALDEEGRPADDSDHYVPSAVDEVNGRPVDDDEPEPAFAAV